MDYSIPTELAKRQGLITEEEAPAYAIERRKVEREKAGLLMPELLVQAKNVTNAIIKVLAKAAKGGKIIVSKEEYLVRKKICSMCDYHSRDRCSICGCYCKTKTKLITETCPDGRW